MKAIRQRIFFLGLAMGAITVTSGYFILGYTGTSQVNKKGIFVFSVLIVFVLTGLLIAEYRKLKAAGLIMENSILHIQSVRINTETGGDSSSASPQEGIEIYVSCFGILFDSKIIRFNQDGILLKGVEINQEYICFTYGTDRKTQKTRILHGSFGNSELQSIIDRFRYETGVIPVVYPS